MRTFILSLCVAALIASGCVGPVYLNKKYHSTSAGALRLAILPANVSFNSYEEFTDTEFLDNLTQGVHPDNECLPPAGIRAKLLDNRPYAEAVNKLYGLNYLREEYLATPTLATAFPATELEFIRFCLDEADLVLVPVDFTITSNGAGMAGTAIYQIYDLANGLLVLENKHTATTEKRGGPGVMVVTRELTQAIATDYKKFCLQ